MHFVIYLYTFVDSINVFDCHLSDVFIEYTEIVAKKNPKLGLLGIIYS